MSIEGAILVWLAIGIGITAGVFLVARIAIQLATVLYRVIEKELDRRTAARQTGALTLGLVAGLAVTAFVAGYAILVIFGSLLDQSGALPGQ